MVLFELLPLSKGESHLFLYVLRLTQPRIQRAAVYLSERPPRRCVLVMEASSEFRNLRLYMTHGSKKG